MWVLLLLITGFVIGYSLAYKNMPASNTHAQIAEKAINVLSNASKTIASLILPEDSGGIRFIEEGGEEIEKALISFTFQKQVIRYITRVVNVDTDLQLNYYFSTHRTKVQLDVTKVYLDLICSDKSVRKVQTFISPPYLSGEYGDGYLSLTITDNKGNSYTTPDTHILNTYAVIKEFNKSRII